AEDGIRDRNVTGVQTCALPILTRAPRSAPQTVPCPPSSDVPPMTAAAMASSSIVRPASDVAEPTRAVSTIPAAPDITPMRVKTRSEERRVGKECEAGTATDERR